MASKKTLEHRALKEAANRDFIRNKDIYEKECFDTSSVFYAKMLDILNTAAPRGLTHEAGYELHHRIPRSFFNKKCLMVVDDNNLYKLTYAEHFLVHYYAYMCATKLMKSAMSLAVLEMKRVCTKVDGCTEENAIELSKLFDNVKSELYASINKEYQEKSVKFWRKKYDKTRFFVTDVHRQNQSTFSVEFMCKDCGAKFSRYPYNWPAKKCPYCLSGTGYKESVDLLWFAIDLRTEKAVWFTSHVAYTPSMQNGNCVLDIKKLQNKYQEDFPAGRMKFLYRARVVSVKPEGYDWKLPEARKYRYSTPLYFVPFEKHLEHFACGENNSGPMQKAHRLVSEGKGITVPTYLLDYALEEYKKDPAFMDRLKYVLDKMIEINQGQSFR